MDNPPVWAGIVMRLADGRTYAVEIAEDVTGSIDLEAETFETSLDGFRGVHPTGRRRVRVQVEGWAGHVVQSQPGEPAPHVPSPPAEIGAAAREIEP
jgi:hypothetical protein